MLDFVLSLAYSEKAFFKNTPILHYPKTIEKKANRKTMKEKKKLRYKLRKKYKAKTINYLSFLSLFYLIYFIFTYISLTINDIYFAFSKLFTDPFNLGILISKGFILSLG